MHFIIMDYVEIHQYVISEAAKSAVEDIREVSWFEVGGLGGACFRAQPCYTGTCSLIAEGLLLTMTLVRSHPADLAEEEDGEQVRVQTGMVGFMTCTANAQSQRVHSIIECLMVNEGDRPRPNLLGCFALPALHAQHRVLPGELPRARLRQHGILVSVCVRTWHVSAL